MRIGGKMIEIVRSLSRRSGFSRPLNGRWYPGDDRRVGLRVFPRTWRHHGEPVDDVGHLSAESIGRQLRSLFGHRMPAADRVPRVVPGQRRSRRRRPRRLSVTAAVRGRRPAAHPWRRRLRTADRRLLVSGRLGGGTVSAERRLLRTGRLFATDRTASRRPDDPGRRRCSCNTKPQINGTRRKNC